jgi:uncharacterized membrane protein YgcG
MFKFLFITLTFIVPNQRGNITDHAELLLPKEEGTLSKRIELIESETSIEFLILTLNELNGDQDLLVTVAKEWVLQEEQILILLSKKDELIMVTAGVNVLEKIS